MIEIAGYIQCMINLNHGMHKKGYGCPLCYCPPFNDHPLNPQVSHSKSQQRPEKLVRGGEGETQGAGRTALRFTLRRVRLLDPCAKYGSCKALIDGLRYAGIIYNDREEDITLEVVQEKIAHFKDEETLIEIRI